MTGNVKMLYKHNQRFGLENTEEHANLKNKLVFVFVLCYVPVVITMLICLVLSILSLKLSHLNGDTVQNLQDEVTRLKFMLNNNWIRKKPEFHREMYTDYNDVGDLITSKLRGGSNGIVNNAINAINRTDVIGVVNFIATNDATTVGPESILAKVLLRNHSKVNVASIQHSVEMNRIVNNIGKETLDVFQNFETDLTRSLDAKKNGNGKHITKRSAMDKLPKATASKQFTKTAVRIRDSVEELSGESEPTTRRIDVPPKRSKGRSRYNIETLDERGSSGRKKLLPVIHFDGDSSGYVVGKHTNYNGNGHLSHPSQIYSDWVEAEWVKSMGMNEHFNLDKGLVRIKEGGLYLLYVQIYYLDDHDTNGYRVHKNEEILLQCTTMTHSTERIFKGNTCFSSRVELLKEDDLISIRDLANSRYTIFESGKSFFGMVKLK